VKKAVHYIETILRVRAVAVVQALLTNRQIVQYLSRSRLWLVVQALFREQ